MSRNHAPILDVDAFDAAWPLWGVLATVPPAVVSLVQHCRHASDPAGPIDEGRRYRVGACVFPMLTVWSEKVTGAPTGGTCPDCGAGQVCGIGRDHSATRVTARGLRCEAHRGRRSSP